MPSLLRAVALVRFLRIARFRVLIYGTTILLDARGNAKLSDFGLVTDQIIAGFANFQGYYPHLAPECHANRLTSEQSDIWAFGATAYRILNGDALWPGRGGGAAVVTLVTQGGFAKQLDWLPHIPREWRTFVKKALHDDPTKRHESAADLLSALERLPVEPDWECNFTTPVVRWTWEKKGRIHEVVWDRTDPAAQSWAARTLPCQGSSGRPHTVDGSGGPVTFKEAQAGLEQFFESRVVR